MIAIEVKNYGFSTNLEKYKIVLGYKHCYKHDMKRLQKQFNKFNGKLKVYLSSLKCHKFYKKCDHMLEL